MYDASPGVNVARRSSAPGRGVRALRFHGVDLLAAQHDRRLGRTPASAHTRGRADCSRTSLLCASARCSSARSHAVNGPVVLMKGPEVAEHYEDSLTRAYRDIDLLVGDAEAAWHGGRRRVRADRRSGALHRDPPPAPPRPARPSGRRRGAPRPEVGSRGCAADWPSCSETAVPSATGSPRAAHARAGAARGRDLRSTLGRTCR